MWRTAPQDEILRPNKRIKDTGTDFISELSDDILLHVLSYLTIEEAVRCSSLSHRFRHLSPLVPVRHHLRLGIPYTPRDTFNPRSFKIRKPPSPSFDPETIERGLRSEKSQLTSCEIIPDKWANAEEVAGWSDALACRGIRELLIDFRRYTGPDAWSVVAWCKSLRKLELRSGSLFEHRRVGCIFLTHLRLVDFRVNYDMLHELTSECKSLISLELIGCDGFKSFKLKDARRLKNLSFNCPVEMTSDVVERIEIEAPNLEVLELRTPALQMGIDVVAPRLRTVHLCLTRVQKRYFPLMAPRLWKIICGAGVSCLNMHGCVLECLSLNRMPDMFSTPFLNLKCMCIDLVLNSGPQALCLAILLQNSSSLNELNLVVIKADAPSVWETPRKAVFEEHTRRLESSNCISNRLEHVAIFGFTGELYEMELSSFILSRAHALKKMNISLSNMCNNEGKMKANSLSQLVKASPKAKLLIKKGREPIPNQ